ncbi:unnamed protein product [Owenia fusiformis]|uniref:Uncharacterized protein n=1 Tax=Owenia fusiformis TaxID=6347 RepID=A0A8J1TCC7_OWEFU|nr:unnamed protein product [Owenia fusiformis]
MKITPVPLLLCFSSYFTITYQVDPKHSTDNCIAFESTYHLSGACECVVYQSYGKTTGTFTSPNNPQAYPPELNCILYTFIGDINEIVELTFYEFDLQMPDSKQRCQDHIKFFLDLERPEVSEKTTWNEQVCGNISMIQRKYYSSARSMVFEFHTDNIITNNTGFRGKFKFIDQKQFRSDCTKQHDSCNYICTSEKNKKTGKFFSPRYPQNYPEGSECHYQFQAGVGERVLLTFHNIQLEDIHGSCSHSPDKVTVIDGITDNDPVVAEFCRTHNQEEISSTGQEMYVKFSVDGKRQMQGFSATYTFIQEDDKLPTTVSHPTKIPVGGHGKASTESKGISYNPDKPPTFNPNCHMQFSSSTRKNGTFASPNFPQAYPADIQCRYTFQGSGKERVQIFFTDLDLYYPHGDPKTAKECEGVDSVTATVFIDGGNQDIGTFCGANMPPMLMSNDARMTVIFKSMSTSNPTKGFKAVYSFVTNFGIQTGEQDQHMVCGFIYKSQKSRNGTFTSPNYPGFYPRNTECHYYFYAGKGEKVHISFLVFDVEGIPPKCSEESLSDYVEFSNFNHIVDRKMSRYCGNRARPPKFIDSDAEFFRVTFKSNHIYDGHGFEAFYQFREVHDPLSTRQQRGVGSGSHHAKVTKFMLCFMVLYYVSPLGSL